MDRIYLNSAWSRLATYDLRPTRQQYVQTAVVVSVAPGPSSTGNKGAIRTAVWLLERRWSLSRLRKGLKAVILTCSLHAGALLGKTGAAHAPGWFGKSCWDRICEPAFSEQECEQRTIFSLIPTTCR
eukprot:385436-Rhodomonas_salina.1